MLVRNYINLYPIRTFISFKGSNSNNGSNDVQVRMDNIKRIIQKADKEQKKMSFKELKEQSGYTKKQIDYVFTHNSKINAIWNRVNSSTRLTAKERARKMEELKNVLQEAKENNIQMTLSELSARTGLGRSAVNHYVSENDELNKLWYWVKTKTPSSYTTEEVEEQIEIIKKELELALKQKRIVTREEVAELADIEKSTAQKRIEGDTTLSSLWKQMLAFEEENRRLEIAKIKKVLQEAKVKNLKITQTYISSVTSIPQTTVFRRIQEDTNLNRLFEQTRAIEHNQREHTDIVADDEKIRGVLTEVVNSGQKMTQSELASKIPDIEDNIVISRLNHNPILNSLWEQIRKDENTYRSADEIAEIIDRVTQILTGIKNNGDKITLSELAKLAQIEADTLHKYIKSSPALDVLWKSTYSRPNVIYTKEEIDLQNIIIERILKQRKKEGIKPTYYQMCQYLDLTRITVVGRINNNEKLSNLYEIASQDNTCISGGLSSLDSDCFTSKTTKKNMKYTVKQKEEEVKKLKAALNMAIKNKRLLDPETLSKKTGIDIEIVKLRLSTNNELRLLKDEMQVAFSLKAESKDEIKAEELKTLLAIINKNKQNLTDSEISFYLGVDKDELLRLIKKFPQLKPSYNASLLKIKSSSQLEKRAQIKSINKVVSYIPKNESYHSLSKKAGLSPEIIRIRADEDGELFKRLIEAEIYPPEIYSPSEIEEQEDKIMDILLMAIKKREMISMEDLAKKAGVLQNIALIRLKNNTALFETYEIIKSFK